MSNDIAKYRTPRRSVMTTGPALACLILCAPVATAQGKRSPLYAAPPPKLQPAAGRGVVTAAGLAPAAVKPGQTLRMATRIVRPFVFEEDGKLAGFSIELWQNIADELDIKTKFTPYSSVKELLKAVKSNKEDGGIAAISITADREKEFDFSHPMLDAGLQIMVRDDSGGGSAGPLQSILALVSSKEFFQLVVIVVILSFIAANIIWLIERRHSDGLLEDRAYFPGILKAIWWSAGTLGAQADEMPKSMLGRMVAIVWMFTGIVFVAYFTATVTAAMTVQQLQGDINGPDDLPGKRVATTVGSTSEKYLKAHNVRVTTVPQIEKAYEALVAHKVDAVVFDAPVLLYYAGHEGSGKVRVVGSLFHKEGYGIVFQAGGPYRKPVNNALLELKENGTYDKLYDKWFGGE